MNKLARRLLLCVAIAVIVLGLVGTIERRFCGPISIGALLLIQLLDKKNRGEWRFLSVEEAETRLSKNPRLLRYLRRDPPDNMPLGAWRALRNPPWPAYTALIAPVPVLVLLVVMTGRIKTAVGGSPVGVATALGAVWFTALFAFIALHSVPTRRRRNLCERAAAASYELCLECGYVLRGLPDVHQCPECGTKYERTNIQAIWKEWCAD